jgi:hypothetical protein
MKNLAFAMKLVIMAIGIYMMVMFPNISTPPFISGVAIFTIGLYLGLQGYFGEQFSGCIFKKSTPKVAKKKGLFAFKK